MKLKEEYTFLDKLFINNKEPQAYFSDFQVGAMSMFGKKVRALIPTDKHLYYEYSSQNKDIVFKQIELSCLHLLQNVQAALLKIHIIDFTLENNFLNLGRLRSVKDLLHYAHDTQSLKQHLSSLIGKVREISNDVLFGESLTEYNVKAEYPEPYHILIVNLKGLKADQSQYRDLYNLANTGLKNGVLLILLNPLEDYYERLKAKKERNYTAMNSLGNLSSEAFEYVERVKGQCTHLSYTSEALSIKNLHQRYVTEFRKVNKINLAVYPQEEIEQTINFLIKNNEEEHIGTSFLKIPIGRRGRQEYYFELGSRNQCYHAFIGGLMQMGKTTLLNNIISAIACQYSSDEIRLFLMDYKEGVEFTIFENHPNVEMLYLDNGNTQGAIDLLEYFEQEIARRGKLFKKAKVSNITDYNQGRATIIPHNILIIDEVQVLFDDGFKERRHFNRLFSSLARRGAAFGIHFIITTQTLLEVDIDANILSQIPLRVSFRLATDRDCSKILRLENTAPLKLGRYEVVYNENSGQVGDNVIFKTSFVDKAMIERRIEEGRKKFPRTKAFKTKVIDEYQARETSTEPKSQRKTETKERSGSIYDQFDVSKF